MVSKDILARAKQYLCWDLFQDLSIQLIEVTGSVSYFFAPQDDRSTILLFLKPIDGDYSESLFLLFHEVGHYMAYRLLKQSNDESQYWRLVSEVSGPDKLQFERHAWERGREYFERFVEQEVLSGGDLLAQYDVVAQRSLHTYE